MKKFKDFFKLKIAFVGDIMQHPRQLQIEKERGFSYEGVFDYVQHIFRDCDLVIGNLETTFSGFEEVPEKLCGLFCAPDHFANALQRAGFTHLVMSNNHMFDFSEEGLKRTEKIVRQAGIQPVLDNAIIKGSVNPMELVNFTTHFNQLEYNAPIPPKLFKKYTTYKVLTNNPKICFVHWGGQYNPEPNEEQRTVAKELIDKGFKIIIGSGPHTPHGCEMIGKSFVHWSLGDFLSAHDKEGSTDIGKILKMTINNDRVEEYREYNTETIFTDNGYAVVINN